MCGGQGVQRDGCGPADPVGTQWLRLRCSLPSPPLGPARAPAMRSIVAALITPALNPHAHRCRRDNAACPGHR